MTASEVVSTLFAILNDRGHRAYFGEAVSELEHALQAAWLAQDSGASDALVAAALLHDLGHLLHGLNENIAEDGVDGHHEDVGAAWLRPFFGPEVTETIQLHVAAKRYLAAVNPNYGEALSEASRQSLQLQGGPFSKDEASTFEQHPHSAAAVALRSWDDAAKVPGAPVPALETYRNLLERLATCKGGPSQ